MNVGGGLRQQRRALLAEGHAHLVVVPAGSFMMGSPLSDPDAHRDERPRRRVTIDYPFAVGVYEVMFDEWDVCVRSGGFDETYRVLRG